MARSYNKGPAMQPIVRVFECIKFSGIAVHETRYQWAVRKDGAVTQRVGRDHYINQTSNRTRYTWGRWTHLGGVNGNEAQPFSDEWLAKRTETMLARGFSTIEEIEPKWGKVR